MFNKHTSWQAPWWKNLWWRIFPPKSKNTSYPERALFVRKENSVTIYDADTGEEWLKSTEDF